MITTYAVPSSLSQRLPSGLYDEKLIHRQIIDISRILIGNKIVDLSNVGACQRCSNYIFILD